MHRINNLSKNNASEIPIIFLLIAIIITSFYAVVYGNHDLRSRASPLYPPLTPQIKCGISAYVKSAQPGQTIIYHIWMQNVGTESLSNMIWKDRIDSNYLTLSAHSIGGNTDHGRPEYCTVNTSTNEIDCVYYPVEPGVTLTDTYVVKVNNNAEINKNIENTMRVATDAVKGIHEGEYCSSKSTVLIVKSSVNPSPTPTINILPIHYKQSFCHDNDNGDNFLIPGTCQDNTGTYSDSCGYGNMHRVLYEYHCVKDKNVCQKTEYLCDRNCNSAGTACLP